MEKYELMTIIQNGLDEKDAEKLVKTNIVGRIEKEFKGKVSFDDFWGARGFAYIIKKQKWGYYHVCQFEMDNTNASALRHELNLDGDVVRFLLIKVDPRAPEPKPYSELKSEYEAQEKKVADEKNEAKQPAAKVNKDKREKLSTIKSEAKPEVKTEEAPKDSVDKKLDAIVDESSEAL